jgi:hypothetical protein
MPQFLFFQYWSKMGKSFEDGGKAFLNTFAIVEDCNLVDE